MENIKNKEKVNWSLITNLHYIDKDYLTTIYGKNCVPEEVIDDLDLAIATASIKINGYSGNRIERLKGQLTPDQWEAVRLATSQLVLHFLQGGYGWLRSSTSINAGQVSISQTNPDEPEYFLNIVKNILQQAGLYTPTLYGSLYSNGEGNGFNWPGLSETEHYATRRWSDISFLRTSGIISNDGSVKIKRVNTNMANPYVDLSVEGGKTLKAGKALEWDKTIEDTLNVKVDNSTIQINSNNQLIAVGAHPSNIKFDTSSIKKNAPKDEWYAYALTDTKNYFNLNDVQTINNSLKRNNSDILINEQGIKDNQAQITINTDSIGTLSQLTTSHKSNLVNAINEVNAKPAGGSYTAGEGIVIKDNKISQFSYDYGKEKGWNSDLFVPIVNKYAGFNWINQPNQFVISIDGARLSVIGDGTLTLSTAVKRDLSLIDTLKTDIDNIKTTLNLINQNLQVDGVTIDRYNGKLRSVGLWNYIDVNGKDFETLSDIKKDIQDAIPKFETDSIQQGETGKYFTTSLTKKGTSVLVKFDDLQALISKVNSLENEVKTFASKGDTIYTLIQAQAFHVNEVTNNASHLSFNVNFNHWLKTYVFGDSDIKYQIRFILETNRGRSTYQKEEKICYGNVGYNTNDPSPILCFTYRWDTTFYELLGLVYEETDKLFIRWNSSNKIDTSLYQGNPTTQLTIKIYKIGA